MNCKSTETWILILNLEMRFARLNLLSLSWRVYGPSEEKKLTSLVSRLNRFFFQIEERPEFNRYLSARDSGIFPTSGGGSKAINEVVCRRARQAPLKNLRKVDCTGNLNVKQHTLTCKAERENVEKTTRKPQKSWDLRTNWIDGKITEQQRGERRRGCEGELVLVTDVYVGKNNYFILFKSIWLYSTLIFSFYFFPFSFIFNFF